MKILPLFADKRKVIALASEAAYLGILWLEPNNRALKVKEQRAFLRHPALRAFETLPLPEVIEHADEETLDALFDAVREWLKVALSPRPRRRSPRPPKRPITDVASWQKALDEHYADREVAAAAGQPEPFVLKPPRPRRRAQASAASRPRRESITHTREQVRQGEVGESQGPPPRAADDDDPDPAPDPDDERDHWQPLGGVLLRLIDRLADDFRRGAGRGAPT